MRRTPVLCLVVFVLLALSVRLIAQRGGRGGGSAAPSTLTAYESAAYGIAFPVPPDVSLYTPQQPGRYEQVFRNGYVAYLVNLLGKDITIGMRAMPGLTEADLKGLLQTLETNPPQAKQPGYKKVSAGSIKIGDKGDKDAVDYVYSALNRDAEMETRQVSFVHKGKGFTVTCMAPVRDFDAVNKKTFDRLFASLRFD